MATNDEHIFRVPPRFYTKSSMSPLEYCQSLTFLPDESPLPPDAFNHWRGTPWVCERTHVSPQVGRALHWGSTPDFDVNFNDTEGLRQPNTKCAVIGSGRPKPKGFSAPDTTGIKLAPESEGFFAPNTTRIKLAKGFLSPDITSIKLANARLTRPKVSKFAKFFPSAEQHDEETATVNRVNERSHTATWTINPSLRQIIRARRPNIGPHGDMSNLRPEDPGMDAATCARIHGPIAISEDRHPNDDSDDSNTSTSTRVTFDEAQSVTRSTPEQRAHTTARARDMVNEERAATMHTVTTTLLPPDSEEQLTTTEHVEEIADAAARLFWTAVEDLQMLTLTCPSDDYTWITEDNETEEEGYPSDDYTWITEDNETEEEGRRGRTLSKWKSSATRERSESRAKRDEREIGEQGQDN